VGSLALGFSAFTNAHKSNLTVTRDVNGKITGVNAVYFRKIANASTSTDMTASHYVYSDGALADCTAGTNDICESEWNTTNPPVDGQSPSGSPTFVTDESPKGNYNGN
jgi:hypothetical protein